MGSVTGAAEAIARLKKLKGDAAQAADAGHRQLAARAAEQMRATAPQDTGQLAGTIRVQRDSSYRTDVIVGDDTTFYLGFQEFGTRHQEARPFVRPAAGQAEVRLEPTMLTEARKRIR